MRNSTELLPENLRHLLKESGLSQQRVADLAGMEQSQLSGYLLGKRFPGGDALDAIAKGLGVTVADLFRTDETPKANIIPLPPEEALQAVLEEIKLLRSVIAPKKPTDAPPALVAIEYKDDVDALLAELPQEERLGFVAQIRQAAKRARSHRSSNSNSS